MHDEPGSSSKMRNLQMTLRVPDPISPTTNRTRTHINILEHRILARCRPAFIGPSVTLGCFAGDDIWFISHCMLCGCGRECGKEKDNSGCIHGGGRRKTELCEIHVLLMLVAKYRKLDMRQPCVCPEICSTRSLHCW